MAQTSEAGVPRHTKGSTRQLKSTNAGDPRKTTQSPERQAKLERGTVRRTGRPQRTARLKTKRQVARALRSSEEAGVCERARAR